MHEQIKQWLATAVAMGVLGVAVTKSVAEPVTLRLDATVDSTPSTLPFDSGLTIAPGDVIQVELVFEENSGNGTDLLQVTQANAMALFSLNNTTLKSIGQDIMAVNDLGRNSDCTDFFCPEIVDSIEFVGTGLQSLGQAVSPQVDLQESSFAVRFQWNDDPSFGGFGVWDSASITGDPAIWNSPPLLSKIQIAVIDGVGSQLTVFATIEQITVVPEPLTNSLAIALGFALSWSRAHREYLFA